MYRRWGFKQVGQTKWEVVDFKSIILAKDLTAVRAVRAIHELPQQ